MIQSWNLWLPNVITEHLCFSTSLTLYSYITGMSPASSGGGMDTFSALKNVGQVTKDGVLGSANAPIHAVTTQTGTLKNLLWSMVRTAILGFLLLLGAGALVEGRGVGKGLLPYV